MKRKLWFGFLILFMLCLTVPNTAMTASAAKQSAKWQKDSTGKWYDYGNGTYPKNKWMTINGKRYYFNKNGYAVTGWQKIKKDQYYFNKNGVMQTKKWIKTGKYKYYVTGKGKRAVSKWIGRRYVDTKGRQATGWLKIDKKRYYFQKNGVMKTGWHKQGSDYYFLDTRQKNLGVMFKGWINISGNYYYFFRSGKMAKSVNLEADGYVYKFNDKGICVNYPRK